MYYLLKEEYERILDCHIRGSSLLGEPVFVTNPEQVALAFYYYGLQKGRDEVRQALKDSPLYCP